RRQPRRRPPRRLHLYVDRLTRGAEHHHSGFETYVFHRRGEAESAAIGVHHEEPHDNGQCDREKLQLPVAREGRQHHGADDGGSAGRAPRRTTRNHPRQIAGTPSVGAPSKVSSCRRRASGPARVSMPPSTVTESLPVSSDTTTPTASVSSVTPSAARWRVPSWRASWLLRDSG